MEWPPRRRNPPNPSSYNSTSNPNSTTGSSNGSISRQQQNNNKNDDYAQQLEEEVEQNNRYLSDHRTNNNYYDSNVPINSNGNNSNDNNNNNNNYGSNNQTTTRKYEYNESFGLSDDQIKLLPSFGSMSMFQTEEQPPAPASHTSSHHSEDRYRQQQQQQQQQQQYPPQLSRHNSNASAFAPLTTILTNSSNEADGGGGDGDQSNAGSNNSRKIPKYAPRAMRTEDPHGGFGGRRRRRRYSRKVVIMTIFAYIFIIIFTLMILIVPIILDTKLPRSEWCPIYNNCYTSNDSTTQTNCTTTTTSSTSNNNNKFFPKQPFPRQTTEYENPDFNTDPCRYHRLPILLYLTLEEADHCRRLLSSVLMGFAIGYERRSSDRPAGIRTMGLVSLGSCFFTISSIAVFRSSTMGWDASRVSAAIPSGVGFLGAGLIWKGSVGEGKNAHHQVHGLTTAASVWLSAAVGVGAGGRLYFVSAYSVIVVMIILRYGPRIQRRYLNNAEDVDDEDGEDDDDDDEDDDDDDDDDDDIEDEQERRHLIPRKYYRAGDRGNIGIRGHGGIGMGSIGIGGGGGNTNGVGNDNGTANRGIMRLDNNKEAELQRCDNSIRRDHYTISADDMLMFQRWKNNETVISQGWGSNSNKNQRKIPSDGFNDVGVIGVIGDGNGNGDGDVSSEAWKNSATTKQKIQQIDTNHGGGVVEHHESDRHGQSCVVEGLAMMENKSRNTTPMSVINSTYLEKEVPIHGTSDGCGNDDVGGNASITSYSSDNERTSFGSALSFVSEQL